MKMKAYASYSLWEKEESKTNKLTKIVSKYVHAVVPHLETSVKWGQGCFLKNGKPAMYIHTEPNHIQLGFYAGAKLKDPSKLLEGKGKYIRHLKIISKRDLQNKNVDYFINQVI